MFIASVILAMIAFSISIVLSSIQEFIVRFLPLADDIVGLFTLLRVVPGLVLYGALYLLFYSLTPQRYRKRGCLKWPGALFVTLWRSEEHTSELQSLMRISYAVFCLKKQHT